MTHRLIALVALLATLAACAPDPVNAARDLPELLAAWQARSDAVGVAMAVDVGGDTWAGAEGLSDADAGTRLSVDDKFRIGSVTKTFTAVVVLQLAEEGSLRLDDPVTRYVDDFPWGEGVSARHLLAHTSGIPDYQRVDGFLDRQRTERYTRWTAHELIDMIADRPLDFQPGTRFSYSNTNYTALGQVIRFVSGSSWATQVRQRILDPLGMQATFIPSLEDVPGGVVAGYADTDANGQLENVGGGSWPALETEGDAVGNIISTVAFQLWWKSFERGFLIEHLTRRV